MMPPKNRVGKKNDKRWRYRPYPRLPHHERLVCTDGTPIFSSIEFHLKQVYKVNRKRRLGEDLEEIELLCGLLRGLVLEDATTVNSAEA